MLRLFCPGLVLLLWLLGMCCAWSQDSNTQDARSVERVLGERPSEVMDGPDVFLLPDRSGNLRRVLGFRYEDFLDAWQATRMGETPVQVPSYAMQTLKLEGQVLQDKSQGPCVRLRIAMELHVERGESLEVVLQLGALILERYSLHGAAFQQEAGGAQEEEDDRKRHEFLMFDSERNRYVAWLHSEPSAKSQHGDQSESGERGERSKRRTILLEGLVPLAMVAGDYQLRLALPRAVKSELNLRVPDSQVVGQVPHGHLLATKALPSGGTHFLVTGMPGECNLRWRPTSQLAQRGRTAALVEEETVVKVDLQGVRYDTRLHMANLQDTNQSMLGSQAEMSRIRIRLPPGCQLVNETSSPDYDLVPSMDNTINRAINNTISSLFSGALSQNDILSPKESLPLERKVVEVLLRPGRQRPVTIHLIAERPFGDEHSERSVDMSGFELVGAVRQSGYVSLQLDEQLQGYFDLEGAIHQIDAKDLPEGMREQIPHAAFSIARSQWQLHLHTVKLEPQIRVKPNFELELEEGSTRLHGQLDYQYTGARPYLLRIDMRGWKLTDALLESGGAVDRNRTSETNQGLLVLPLVKSDSRQIKISFVARRRVPQDASKWPLPVPLGAFVLPGNFSVRSNPSLLVTSQSNRMKGLVPLPTIPSDYVFQGAADNTPGADTSDDGPNPVTSQSTMSFYQLYKPRAEFCAEISRRARKVAVEMEGHVQIDNTLTTVTQKLRYQVEYQPIKKLVLKIPQNLSERTLQGEMPSFTLQGNPLNALFSAEGQSGDTEELAYAKEGALQNGKIVLELPHAMQGKFEVEVTYPLASGPWQIEAALPLQVPFIVPLETVTSCQVHVKSSVGLRALLQPAQEDLTSTWSSIGNSITVSQETSVESREDNIRREGESAGIETALLLSSSEAPPWLPLVVQVKPMQRQDQTTLVRAWLQTWLLGSIRQERAVLRFRTKQPRVYLSLPFQEDHPQVEVLLDHQPVTTQWEAAGRISVPVKSGLREATHTLEIRYQTNFTSGPWLRLRIAPVQMECQMSGEQVFWQLVLPKHYYVTDSPASMAGEYWLGWRNYHWGRHPTLFQSDMETWSGALSLQQPPPSFNQYVYSSFQMPSSIRVSMVTKAWLVSVSSVFLFFVGVLMVATPLGRSVVFWFTLSLAALVLVVARAEIAMVVAVGMFGGGVLTLFSLLLRRLLLDANGQTVLPMGRSSALRHETRSTELWPDQVASSQARVDQGRPSSEVSQALTTSLHANESAS
ncbi:MAG: hypothetical protein ABGX16_06055 [Pirellulales bacterium]